MANAIRALAMDAVQKAKSGHPGMPMGMADVATVLFTRFLKFDAAEPDWADRDRFVLSAGHGSMLLYALLYLTGYPEMTSSSSSTSASSARRRRPPGIRPCARHRDHHRAARPGHRQCRRHGDRRAAAQCAATATISSTITPIARRRRLPDGRHQPGGDLARRPSQARPARSCSSTTTRSRSTARPSLAVSDDQLKRFRASNWHVARVDGHDPEAIAARHRECAHVSDRPSLIACRTIIGYGAPTKRAPPPPTARRSARRKSPARARRSTGRHAAFEVPKRRPRGLARGRRAAAARAQGLGGGREPTRCCDARRLERSDRRRRAKAIAAAIAALKASFAKESAEARHAPVIAEGARELGAGRSRPDRRLRRSHRLQRHAAQSCTASSAAATSPATTSITACASMAWRLP